MTSSFDRVDVVREVGPLLLLVTEALDFGASKAASFFNGEGELPDRYLHPALVRWNAKRFLRDSGHVVEEEEGDHSDVDSDELANNGILVSYKEFQLRVLKAEEGNLLPVPGRSEAKQAFYSQQLAVRFNDAGDAQPIRMNLVLLWDVDGTQALSRLVLVYPRTGGVTRSSVSEYWRYDLELGESREPESLVAEPAIEDLPLTLADRQESDEKSAG